jgi:hypothetical protein
MRTYLFTFSFLFTCLGTFCQDGSNIMYYKSDGIDSTFIGSYVHFDFYKNSFRGKHLDTVNISLYGKATIEFLEKRKDNGYNNWFDEQYLESIKTFDSLKIVITKFRIDKIDSLNFETLVFAEYYSNDSRKKRFPQFSKTYKSTIRRRDVIEILIQTKYK